MEDEERRNKRRARRTSLRVFPSLSILIAVAFASFPLLTISFPLSTDLASGWSLSVMHGRSRTVTPSAAQIGFQQQPLRSSGSSETTSLYAERTTEKDDQVSEMDARILQSMLRDNKLDLEQTSNMKKLLERGIRKDDENEKSFSPKKTEEETDDTYSSQIIKTLADTKFWKAFKRNAGEVLESVAISFTNEIEKGAKVLVGLGFFAWERAAQDVARALPNAATIPKKRVFQLGETSSFVEPKAAEEEDDETIMTPSQRAKSIRQEFTTPADELSAVTAEIGKIFQRADRQVALQSQQEDKSKDTRNPFFAAFAEERELQQQKSSSGGDSTPFYASASLSTTASRGSARLDKAFERTQKTKLAREKENLAVKGNRLASAAIDSAYQVKTEITSEENVPGYKTKQLRESTVDVSRRLAGVAKKTAGFLGGASSFLLGGKDKEQQQLPEVGTSASTNNQADADPVDFLDDASYFAFKREESPPGTAPPPVSAEDMDLSGGIIDTDQPESGGGGAFGFLSAITKRGKKSKTTEAPRSQQAARQASPQQQPEMEIITDAEVVMANKDNFNFYDADDVVASGERAGSSKDFFTTNGYLDNMEVSASTAAATEVVDDGLRKVTAELISDDDFDETVFAQATTVDNMSADELLQQQASEEAEENSEPSFITKATLRTLDVAFLVVEKSIGVAPAAFEVAQRAASRATEAKLKDSAGSQIGWESHNGNVRGDKRY